MKFSVFDVMDKGLYLKQTLEAAGHEPVPVEEADVLILDCDWEWAAPRPALIDEAVSRGVKVALYPHGGMPTVHVYDGLTEPHPGVDVRFEHGPGSIDLAVIPMGREDLKQVACGWLYCPTVPFAPVENPYRILFAPLHPNIEMLNNGGGPDPAPALNRHVYQQLLDMGLPLTVSAVGPLWRNGIWAHPRATIANTEMRFSRAYGLIQQADVVVAAGTVAAAAVACGKPTVMIGGHDCCDYIGGRYVRATHADEYQDWLTYPFNAEDGPLADLIAQACAGSDEANDWRETWIGDDGSAAAVKTLEGFVASSSASVTIAGATARSGAQA